VTAIVTRGDAANLPLPDGTVDLIMTSPPYFGLRSYTDGGAHYEGQVGDEATPTEYLDALITCTREWMRVLKPGGSIFVNLGDRYAGSSSGDRNNGFNQRWGNAPGRQAQERSQTVRPGPAGLPAKSLVGLPWRYALRCVDELGLILRAEIVWSKSNGLPESVTDRVRRSHEQVFHFVKQARYYSAVAEVREAHLGGGTGRSWAERKAMGQAVRHGDTGGGASSGAPGSKAGNPLGKLPGSVWSIPTSPLTVPESLGVDHFAAYPPELVRRIVLGWSPREVCAACGEGRRPVSATELTRNRKGRTSQRDMGTQISGGVGNQTLGWERVVSVTGWACACPAPTVERTIKERDEETWERVTRVVQVPDPSWVNPAPTVPGVVLDPFGGTGTTALVASVFGRVGISVDLSADYCRLARWRTTDPGERARALDVPKPEKPVEGQLCLFDGLGA
jgi:DNA modification methylase